MVLKSTFLVTYGKAIKLLSIVKLNVLLGTEFPFKIDTSDSELILFDSIFRRNCVHCAEILNIS